MTAGCLLPVKNFALRSAPVIPSLPTLPCPGPTQDPSRRGSLVRAVQRSTGGADMMAAGLVSENSLGMG